MRYQDFCMADPLFYEPIRENHGGVQSLLTGREIPAGWMVAEQSDWTMLAPAQAEIPAQGWKIHVSAKPDNADAVLDVVWEYCVLRHIPFKFVPSKAKVVARNSKYADRSGSGKFVTIYPAGNGQLQQIVADLQESLSDQDGPYILSDLRIGRGPVFVRYGAFVPRFLRTANGEPVHAIEGPDGTLEEDRREPAFAPPAWVQTPEFLAPHLAARDSDEGIDFPFTIVEPLHFSNGGGIYKAIDNRTDQEVILREGRPFAGLDAASRDAVERVGREGEILQLLTGLPCVPALYDQFTCWEHAFLVEEFIPGKTFGKETVQRYPLIHPDAGEEVIAEYTTWALATLDKIRAGLDLIHERGVVFGDLHPHNVLVRPDGEVCFVDFEISTTDVTEMVGMGAAGYMAPLDVTGFARDEYAMACMRMTAFFPLNAILPLDPGKITDVVRAIGERFPVPEEFLATILRELDLPVTAPVQPAERREAAALVEALDAGEDVVDRLCESIAAGILASASPERTDRLYPADINVFLEDPLSLAWGAAGVMHALHTSGFDVPEEHVDWLLQAVGRAGPDHPIGLYNGLHGVAYALEQLGRRDAALDVLDRVLDRPLDHLPTGLQGGLAGIGMNLLHFSTVTGRSDLTDTMDKVVDRLADIVERPSAVANTSRQNGLMRGASGRALLFTRLFEHSGDQRFLDLARREIDRDLDECVDVADGTLQMDEGFRVMPYLATGSAGVAVAAAEFLKHEHVERFDSAIDRIGLAAQPEFVICPGLFNGRSGLIGLLTQLRSSGARPAERLDPIIARLVRRLAWHAVSYKGHVAFPGEPLLRLSMDVATGSAGVLMALRASQGSALALPGLAPAVRPERAVLAG
ncbi:class III lanthionine synthetase LanKC [Pseudonocardia sp. TRM90224]|uniref:class III lanthionine synthetase LanKC n=1 Tax=Pseudonocardia sp. TRM90224 TaxID=2812678 RepID=UPI0021023DC5|nr:class III lanthionine synthetase LanKC [Pseudonocardia sp. TRM90224]